MKGTNWKIYFGIEIVFQFIYLNKARLNANNENIKLRILSPMIISRKQNAEAKSIRYLR